MAIMISSLDKSNPLHLHPNDSNCASVVSIKLSSVENYRVWSSAVNLLCKLRIKWVFLMVVVLNLLMLLVLFLKLWDRCNAVVLN